MYSNRVVSGAFLKNCLERLGTLDKNGDYGEFGARYRARGPSGRGGSASDGPRQQMGPSAKTHSDDVSPHLPLRNRPFGGGIFGVSVEYGAVGAHPLDFRDF